MENNQRTDFMGLVKQVESKQILLPDFQREFVWKDEEMQKKIVASLLSKMPIGSVLLLKSKPDEYASKFIGCKQDIDTTGLTDDVMFLLDGQQRITVLTNVFSSVIHDQCAKVTDLVSPSLKRRFFLRIPRWVDVYSNSSRDLFGVKTLDFPYENPSSQDPDFLSGEILPFIESAGFLNGDEKPYNPQVQLSIDLDAYCTSQQDGYLIPLFLLIPSSGTKAAMTTSRYEKIVHKVAEAIADEIDTSFQMLFMDDQKNKFIDDIFKDKNTADEIKKDNSKFAIKINEKAEYWEYCIKNYLSVCLKEAVLNRIIVSEEQRARAIDIYENLNRGGISLNTFDLVMARVATVSKENFYKRLVAYINAGILYPDGVIPAYVKKYIQGRIDANTYKASTETDCYNESKNEIASRYIDAFLDVLSLYCYNKEYDPDLYVVDNIKRNKILSLSPNQINDNCKMICDAIDRALYFFQNRCGLRSIKEINYGLMLVLVATIFTNDEWFNDSKVHDKLEAWYWSALFSGEYDKDQNTIMITNLQQMVRTLTGAQNTDWIMSMRDRILAAENFSDKDLLLMRKVSEDRVPKVILRSAICQYLLANTYADMFDDQKVISVFCPEASSLEAHHIIPLGSVKKYGECTAVLRDDPKNICNSPLNFVLITQKANKEILEDPLSVYINKITASARSGLYITAYTNPNCTDSEIEQILEQRFIGLQGDIKSHVTMLI